MKAILLLEDGTVFEGTSFGYNGRACGEVVFNTSMTGYQEILTDPSYNEQIITMTYPLIGNYGTNDEDVESARIFARGLIVKEACDFPSNWRNSESLADYLRRGKIVGLCDIDTRKLVRHIRTAGAMKGIIASDTDDIATLKKELKAYPGLVARDIVKDVTAENAYQWDKGIVDVSDSTIEPPAEKYKVVAYDFGTKHNILRLLRSHGCHVHVVPASTSAEDVLALKPDGIFLSNGPATLHLSLMRSKT